MVSALVSSSAGPGAPPLEEDLHAVGIDVLDAADSINLLQGVVKHAPDLVIVHETSPSSALFDSIEAIEKAAPRPVILFTSDPDADKIATAVRSGVDAYVINGYHANRLRSVIHLAQARFNHRRSVDQELSDLKKRFDERKLVDRAKGILMGARQLREDEAYRALRGAAMHSKQRVGQVSRMVIDQAGYAEAVNRAGQLRMLSQRLVKLHLLALAGVEPDTTRSLFIASMQHVEDNLATLGRILSQPTYGDLLSAVLTPWRHLRLALLADPRLDRLDEIDGLADHLLSRAEQLTANLEIVGYEAELHAINVSGRQRMLSQRLAKQALLASLAGGKLASAAAHAMEATRSELIGGLSYLQNLPLSNAEIARELRHAVQAWEIFEQSLSHLGSAPGRERLAQSSEVLLGCFERVTDEIERGMQALIH